VYCEQCKRLTEAEGRCPYCGNRNLREPADGDWCRVYEGIQLWADMACDVLKQNEIPSLVQSSRGAAMAVLTGMYSDTCEVYVAYQDYARAEEIVQELFSPDAVVEDGPDGPDGETEEEEEP